MWAHSLHSQPQPERPHTDRERATHPHTQRYTQTSRPVLSQTVLVRGRSRACQPAVMQSVLSATAQRPRQARQGGRGLRLEGRPTISKPTHVHAPAVAACTHTHTCDSERSGRPPASQLRSSVPWKVLCPASKRFSADGGSSQMLAAAPCASTHGHPVVGVQISDISAAISAALHHDHHRRAGVHQPTSHATPAIVHQGPAAGTASSGSE